MLYDYTILDVSNLGALRSGPVLHNQTGRGVAEAGGRVLGFWFTLIGGPMSQVAMLSQFQDADTWRDWLKTASELVLPGGVRKLGSAVLDESRAPIAEGIGAEPGIYTHRWFNVKPGAMDEFVRLSQEGWWTAIAKEGIEVQGFWPALAGATEGTALLITRYRDLAHWEGSRYTMSADNAAKVQEKDMAAINARAELTDGSRGAHAVMKVMKPIFKP